MPYGVRGIPQNIYCLCSLHFLMERVSIKAWFQSQAVTRQVVSEQSWSTVLLHQLTGLTLYS